VFECSLPILGRPDLLVDVRRSCRLNLCYVGKLSRSCRKKRVIWELRKRHECRGKAWHIAWASPAPSRCLRYPDVTAVLQRCYSDVTVVLQWCYSGVTVVLQWCYSVVTMFEFLQRPLDGSITRVCCVRVWKELLQEKAIPVVGLLWSCYGLTNNYNGVCCCGLKISFNGVMHVFRVSGVFDIRLARESDPLCVDRCRGACKRARITTHWNHN
jgi:hypothetical protein